MTHPDEGRLALLAGRDTGFWDQWTVGRHVRRCQTCRETLKSFQQLRLNLKPQLDHMPPGVNWDRLAAEMKANIHVGLAAGECVDEPGSRAAAWTAWWKPATAVTALLFIAISSFWMKVPRDEQRALARNIAKLWSRGAPPELERVVYLEADRNGIQIKENGAALTIMHPAVSTASATPIVSVSTQGSLRARYIDDDTGQITITNVYAQ
jgi:hypothetical protein